MKFLPIMLLFVASACGNDTAPTVKYQQQPDDKGFADVKAVIDQNCTSCHNGSNGLPKFDSAAAFKGSKAKARLTAGTMPPSGRIDAEAKSKLLAYLNQYGSDDMAKVSVTVLVEENTYKVGQGVAAFVKTLKAQVANGWTPAQALPADLAAVMQDLVPVVGNIPAVPGEAADDKKAFANALALGLTEALLG